jgi:hypothetical protein
MQKNGQALLGEPGSLATHEALAALSIAHHIPGRIRLKLSAPPAAFSGTIDAKRLIAAIGALPGIKATKANWLARSLTIQYDPKSIPAAAWQDLLENRPSPEASALWSRIAGLCQACLASCPSNPC